MMIQGVSVGDMLNQSMTVLTKPSVQSFEQFEKRGGQREALIYVVIAAVLVGGCGVGLWFSGRLCRRDCRPAARRFCADSASMYSHL